MEYTPTSFTAQLNPCDYNHNDLPFIRTKSYDKKSSLLACRNLHHIKIIRKNLEAGTLITESIKMSGLKNPSSFYVWMQRYHSKRLKNYILAAQMRGYNYSDESVEGAFYKKLKEGRGTGSEYEFFLTNRQPMRWKKTNEFAPTDSGAPLLKQRPVINYIAVHAENATVHSGGNGHDNGGNGLKRIEEQHE